MKKATFAILTVAVLAASYTVADAKYRPGGKLAGEMLPLYPTHHGEPAGYPGCIPALAEKATAERAAAMADNPELPPYNAENALYGPQGMAPKEYLYEGSVEHWSAYWFKYLPLHAMFDRQSLLKNWLAATLPESQGAIEQYREPVYWLPRHSREVDTGYRNDPVNVVRTKVGSPAWSLDCGTLAPGLYCLRAIGAVETQFLQHQRLPLYMRLTIDDGPDGAETTYRMRVPYVDEFYAVPEFYFHAPSKRPYRATLAVEDGSMVELLVHNIELHNALAGVEMRPIKTRRTVAAGTPLKVDATPNTPQLLEKEAALWQEFPPLNTHAGYVYGMASNDGKSNWPRVGALGKTPAELAEEFGTWETRGTKGDVILINKKLDLTYTLSDYRAGRALPDPYPIKDRGLGVWTAPEQEDAKPQNFWPVPNGLGTRMREYSTSIQRLANLYRDRGDVAAGREAAFKLIRVAYDLPGIDARNSMHSVVVQPGSWGRDHGSRRRDPMRAPVEGLGLCEQYDLLFDLITADAGLAQSVGRFIPWVQTPADVITLLDAYLVQNEARRILRYHTYSSNTPHLILGPANTLGDANFTKPWLEWLFSAAFIYPLTPAGVQDLVVSANDRNGMGYIASHYYAHGENSAPIAAYLDTYVDLGGLPQYNLGNPTLYPKPLAACHWFFDSRTAGNWFLPIGDVCGPDKGYGHPLTPDNIVSQSAKGWKWSKEPVFAWALANYGKQGGYSDAEWAAINQAAASVQRAPWLENKSRVLINWGGILESGTAYDDPRYRRSLLIRTGSGWGHHHNDTLDLQLHALGYPMTIDGGQRPGYSTPADRSSLSHNLVVVDGVTWLAHSWVNALSDMPAARYLRAEATPRDDTVKLYTRQAALIDIDQGAADTAPIPPDRRFPKDAPPANSYVFDVQRVSGGHVHTHSFHAMLEDELVCNATDQVKLDALSGDELAFANRFKRDMENYPQSQTTFAGTAPAILEATWRLQRERQGKTDRTEESLNKDVWNPDSPRKYTRLHLFDQAGSRVLSTWSYTHQWEYGWRNIYTRRQSDQELESVFPAIIEPFAGQPIITAREMLPIADNDRDARRAVALAVTTANGHSDLLFADGRPEKPRKVGADTTISAEFAFVSRDAQGLRQATLTGGTLLDHPLIKIETDAAERRATVTATDYPNKRLALDAAWPEAPLMAGRVFEIGLPGHHTTYTAREASSTRRATTITATEGAQFYLSRVRQVDAANNIVSCGLGFTQNERTPLRGLDKHWVASTEDGKKFWRAEYLGDPSGLGNFDFKLAGPPIAASDFSDNQGLRLWEYGVGDQIRQSTFAAVRRLADGTIEITADIGVIVTLPGRQPRRITTAELLKGQGKATL